jgi:hypothetical protein
MAFLAIVAPGLVQTDCGMPPDPEQTAAVM